MKQPTHIEPNSKSQLKNEFSNLSSGLIDDEITKLTIESKISELRTHLAFLNERQGNCLTMARNAFHHGDYSLCILICDHAISLDDDFRPMSKIRCLAFLGLREYGKALLNAEKILAKSQLDPLGYLMKGACQFKLKRYGDAVGTLTLAKEYDDGLYKEMIDSLLLRAEEAEKWSRETFIIKLGIPGANQDISDSFVKKIIFHSKTTWNSVLKSLYLRQLEGFVLRMEKEDWTVYNSEIWENLMTGFRIDVENSKNQGKSLESDSILVKHTEARILVKSDTQVVKKLHLSVQNVRKTVYVTKHTTLDDLINVVRGKSEKSIDSMDIVLTGENMFVVTQKGFLQFISEYLKGPGEIKMRALFDQTRNNFKCQSFTEKYLPMSISMPIRPNMTPALENPCFRGERAGERETNFRGEREANFRVFHHQAIADDPNSQISYILPLNENLANCWTNKEYHRMCAVVKQDLITSMPENTLPTDQKSLHQVTQSKLKELEEARTIEIDYYQKEAMIIQVRKRNLEALLEKYLSLISLSKLSQDDRDKLAQFLDKKNINISNIKPIV